MTVKPFFKRIEIGFWDFAILQMEKAAFWRLAIPRAYRLFQMRTIQRDLRLTLALAALGLATGFVLGILLQG